MTKYELLIKLAELAEDEQGPEENHIDADKALLDYINDPNVTLLFRAIHKWYA